MTSHVGPGELAIVNVAIVGFIALLVAGLSEMGRRVEKRRGVRSSMPVPERPNPKFLMLHWLALHLDQPGTRARVRNVCLVVGAFAIAPYIALVVYNRT